MKSENISLVRLNVVEDRLHMALSGAIWFPIWLSWEDDSFPGEKWEDIGVDIISAITAFLIQGPSHTHQIVQFPDGPYRIILGPADNVKLFIRMENSRMESTGGITYTVVCAYRRKFYNSVLICATRILDRCIKNGWSVDRVEELRQAVDALNRCKTGPKDSDT